MGLCDKQNPNKDQIMQQALQIFRDFILEDSEFELEDNQVIMQLRQGYDLNTERILLQVNETLFSNLILFATGGLEVYYEKFQ